MTEHDEEELTPTWYKSQPNSPFQVYNRETIVDIQRTLSVPETGEMDQRTVSHIRGLQHLFGIDATGVISLETAIQIERLRNRYVGGN